ncbi:MAG: hypothetical protein IVW53_15430 [Chloroflexi bacterium]|nr:hypothetical protein [Chloroflexota bacterium]
MAHGTPDWGATNAHQTTYSVNDLGELAARLGSPDVHDRRGDVVALDSFEDGIARYDFTTVGTESVGQATVQRSQHGAWSVLLRAGANPGDQVQLIASQPPIVRGRVGVEISMSIAQIPITFELHIQSYDGAKLTNFGLLWNATSLALEYNNAANTPVAFATAIDLPVNLPTWNMFKLVADLTTGQYVRAVVNNLEYDLSGFLPPQSADGRAPRVDTNVTVVGTPTTNSRVFVDDMIITQNEP